MRPSLAAATLLAGLLALSPCTPAADDKPAHDPYDQSKVPLEVDSPDPHLAKIMLVAGRASHGPGEHEFFAGCALYLILWEARRTRPKQFAWALRGLGCGAGVMAVFFVLPKAWKLILER